MHNKEQQQWKDLEDKLYHIRIDYVTPIGETEIEIDFEILELKHQNIMRVDLTEDSTFD